MFDKRHIFGVLTIILLLCGSALCLVTTTNTYSYSKHIYSKYSGTFLAAAAEKDLSRDVYIEKFEKLWSDSDIIAKSVRHATFDWVCGSLRGLQATTNQYKKGKVVISLPISQTLSAKDSGMEGCPPGIEDIWSEIRGTSRVSLLLLKEWSAIDKGTKSKFSAYIDTLPLPASLRTPFHWSEKELDEFPYKPLVLSVITQKIRWKELYTKIEKTETFKNVPYDRFVWSMEMVRSRAFTGIGSTGSTVFPVAGAASGAFLGAAVMALKTSGISEMIPIILGSIGVLCLLPAVLTTSKSSCVLLPAIDSSNHQSTNPLCSIALQPFKSSFEMIANKDITIAEQITISYGNRNNDDLLQYFGFIEVDNQYDRYIISDPLLILESILLDKKDNENNKYHNNDNENNGNESGNNNGNNNDNNDYGNIEMDSELKNIQDMIDELEEISKTEKTEEISKIESGENIDLEKLGINEIEEKVEEIKKEEYVNIFPNLNNMIITRNKIDWNIDKINNLKIDDNIGNKIDEKQKTIYIKMILEYELNRLKNSYVEISSKFKELKKDEKSLKLDPCVSKIFLKQKIDVLNVAINQI